MPRWLTAGLGVDEATSSQIGPTRTLFNSASTLVRERMLKHSWHVTEIIIYKPDTPHKFKNIINGVRPEHSHTAKEIERLVIIIIILFSFRFLATCEMQLSEPI